MNKAWQEGVAINFLNQALKSIGEGDSRPPPRPGSSDRAEQRRKLQLLAGVISAAVRTAGRTSQAGLDCWTMTQPQPTNLPF